VIPAKKPIKDLFIFIEKVDEIYIIVDVKNEIFRFY